VARVVVVGSVNVDLVVRVERLPGAGETVIGRDYARHHGGKGANQAIAAARLGASVAFVGAVGDDDLGRAALAALEAEGVDVGGVSVVAGVPTGVALIVVDASGENQIAVASGANAAVDAANVKRSLGSSASAGGDGGDGGDGGVLLTGFELPGDAVLAAARAAVERGMTLVINPAPARPLPGELVALGPLLVPNEHEAATLTGRADPAEACAVLAGLTGAPAIVTLGAAGALLCRGGDQIERLPAPAVDAVDTTGAGDTFMGALAAELATRSSLAGAARFAVAAASLSVTVAGAREGIPPRDQVEAMLRSA
jgi:ribokinase